MAGCTFPKWPQLCLPSHVLLLMCGFIAPPIERWELYSLLLNLGPLVITTEVMLCDLRLSHKRQQLISGCFDTFVLGNQPPSHEEVQTACGEAHKMWNWDTPFHSSGRTPSQQPAPSCSAVCESPQPGLWGAVMSHLCKALLPNQWLLWF